MTTGTQPAPETRDAPPERGYSVRIALLESELKAINCLDLTRDEAYSLFHHIREDLVGATVRGRRFIQVQDPATSQVTLLRIDNITHIIILHPDFEAYRE